MEPLMRLSNNCGSLTEALLLRQPQCSSRIGLLRNHCVSRNQQLWVRWFAHMLVIWFCNSESQKPNLSKYMLGTACLFLNSFFTYQTRRKEIKYKKKFSKDRSDQLIIISRYTALIVHILLTKHHLLTKYRQGKEIQTEISMYTQLSKIY